MRDCQFCGLETKNSNFHKTLSDVYMTLEDFKVEYESFQGKFIKWITSGELTIGLKSP